MASSSSSSAATQMTLAAMCLSWCLVFVLSLTQVSHALDNGLAQTPAMGYNTWYDYMCNFTAQDVYESADAIISQGLDKLGYIYVNMDDCWAQGRHLNGSVYPDPVAFPDGIKAVADYVHSLGLKFGIYTDRGLLTCAGRPGSFGFEEIDALTYAQWGVDFLKEDSCYAASEAHEVAFAEYAKMRDALNATGRPIYFSLCGWRSWYSPVGYTLGNSWRISGDCDNWQDVLIAIDTSANLSMNAKPGGWNDPDILLGSDPVTAVYVTPDQSRAMFSMWSILAAPLLIGSNVRNLNAFDLETYSNAEVIAVDQDPAGVQGIRINGSDLNDGSSTVNIWGRPLSSDVGGWAVVFLNNGDAATDVTCDIGCFATMGFSSDQTLYVRDLWAHTNNGTLTPSDSFTVYNIPANGGSATVRFTTEPVNM
eukprot:TRINITY_DN2398_c0_g2_i1.p1 TRINITY_DN2398_c0_g2~~TRINITY_DN2398_c0_g2_i1.p1  ORF type:complete len:422 (+),score=74.11 TRINITY_DN2398_c0_g2_i1:58-1323(+)